VFLTTAYWIYRILMQLPRFIFYATRYSLPHSFELPARDHRVTL